MFNSSREIVESALENGVKSEDQTHVSVTFSNNDSDNLAKRIFEFQRLLHSYGLENTKINSVETSSSGTIIGLNYDGEEDADYIPNWIESVEEGFSSAIVQNKAFTIYGIERVEFHQDGAHSEIRIQGVNSSSLEMQF